MFVYRVVASTRMCTVLWVHSAYHSTVDMCLYSDVNVRLHGRGRNSSGEIPLYVVVTIITVVGNV